MDTKQAKIFLIESNLTLVEVARQIKTKYPELKTKTKSLTSMLSAIINGHELHPQCAELLRSVYPKLDFVSRESKSPYKPYKFLNKNEKN